MARNINLKQQADVTPEGVINLLEAVGLKLVEQETTIRKHGLSFEQIDEHWVMNASTVTVRVKHRFVRAGFLPDIPVEVREDDLWAEVHEHVPQDNEDGADL
jgi:hypothetical protein